MEATMQNLKHEIASFLFTATPRQLTEFIDHMEHHQHTFALLPGVKKVTFSGMLDILNVSVFQLPKNGRGCGTKLYLQQDTMTLVVSKKDSENLEAAYARLYDKHKDELIQMIEASFDQGGVRVCNR